jgi:anti-sigma B factor antagonist
MVSIETQGAVDVVRVEGLLNQETGSELLERIRNRSAAGQPSVVLQLSEVPLVDSAGLEALLEVRDEIHARRGSVKLAGANLLCQEILRITEVGTHFECFSQVKSAVGSFLR